MRYQHQPVLLKEVMAFINPGPGQLMIDGTLGGGGYTRALARAVTESGTVLALDVDELAVQHAQEWLKTEKIKNVQVINGNFADLKDLVPEKFTKVDGIVLDLGLSSAQLDDPGRGFSFLREGPLNMAFGETDKENTGVIVNRYRVEDLAAILKNYGEERFAKSVARAIVAARPINTVSELLAAIDRGMPNAAKHGGKIHYATKTFQALRLATNRELENLRRVLPEALTLLKRGGRLAVVSFHSLEDRIVKQFFRSLSRDCLCPPAIPKCVCHHRAEAKILTPKPVRPTAFEVTGNPRARSAKLRVIEKL